MAPFGRSWLPLLVYACVYIIEVYFKSAYLAYCTLLTTRVNFSKMHSTAVNAFSNGI